MQTIIASIILAVLTGIALAGPIYVDSWPKRLAVPDGVATDPTPEQCRAAGLELRANRPAAEVAAEAAAAALAAQQAASNAAAQAAAALAVAQAKTNTILALRGKYGATTRALCREIGRGETNALTAAEIETLVLPLMDDADTTAKQKRNTKITAYLVQLEFLTRLLEKEDGSDALDRL